MPGMKQSDISKVSLTRRLLLQAAAALAAFPAWAETPPDILTIPAGRSVRITLPQPMAQVMLADPNVASVHVHNSTSLTIIGGRLGQTALRISDAEGRVLRECNVSVGYDLPALRREIKAALPGETVELDVSGAALTLSGRAGNDAVAERAIKAVRDYLKQHPPLLASGKAAPQPDIMNMLQIAPGQPMAATPPPQAPMEKLFLSAITGDSKTMATGLEGPHGFLLD